MKKRKDQKNMVRLSGLDEFDLHALKEINEAFNESENWPIIYIKVLKIMLSRISEYRKFTEDELKGRRLFHHDDEDLNGEILKCKTSEAVLKFLIESKI